jgi:hypothetical protein
MAKDKTEKVHDYLTHKFGCEECQKVNIAQPSTLSNCCLTGAPLLRDYLNSLVAPVVRKKQSALKAQFEKNQDGTSQRTTRAKLKEVMRYK